MITSLHQKNITLEKIQDLKLALKVPKRPDVNERLHQAHVLSIEALIKDLEKEVKDFEERTKE